MKLLSVLDGMPFAADVSMAGGADGPYAPARTFANRRSAGVALAKALKRLQLPDNPEILALPRGGVPVGFEIAQALRVPLNVMVVRKIGMPGQPELAIGAIASGGVIVREPGVEGRLRLAGIAFDELMQAELRELERRERAYRGDKPALHLAGRTVLIVDDGLATGATMLAAVRSARNAGAVRIVALAPVASDEAAALVGGEVEETVFLKVPAYLNSVGEWYDEFPQLTDAEVCELLDTAARFAAPSSRKRRTPESK
jgi:putative phosphoribosyl transferase